MGLTSLTILVLPAMAEVFRFMAVAVALYFPLAVLVWLAIDKLQKPTEQGSEVHRRRPFQG